MIVQSLIQADRPNVLLLTRGSWLLSGIVILPDSFMRWQLRFLSSVEAIRCRLTNSAHPMESGRWGIPSNPQETGGFSEGIEEARVEGGGVVTSAIINTPIAIRYQPWQSFYYLLVTSGFRIVEVNWIVPRKVQREPAVGPLDSCETAIAGTLVLP